jgi:hypothetical protein
MLEKNGPLQAQNTQHIKSSYFCNKDEFESGKLNVEFCPPKDMIDELFINPIKGNQVFKLGSMMMGGNNQ